MRTVLLLFALISIGCQKTPEPVKDEFAIKVLEMNKQLDSRVQSLQAENKVAYNTLADLRANNEQVTKENDTLKANVAYYKNALDALNKKYAVAVADASTPQPPKSDTAISKARTPIPTDSPALEAFIADLQSRMELLRPKVVFGRSKIASLIRAPVDETYSATVYPGTYADIGGTVIRRSVGNGEFRSLFDKENAIRTAKEENLPLEQELASLEKQLAESKTQLAKLRTAKK
jgi:phage shock protein A